MESDREQDQLVADYLRRLTSAASALPADRRDELIGEITAHIAEARAGGPAGPGGAASVPGILERLGDPVQIVQAAAEPSFGVLPAGAPAVSGPDRQPGPRRPAVPASVRNAVWLMYLGAAVSLVKVIVDLATQGATRRAMQTGLRIGAKKAGTHVTLSQLYSGITPALTMAFVLGLVGVGLWLLVARASRSGRDWARATGSLLFGLDTLALLIGPSDVGIRGPEAAVTRVFTGAVWLIGLAAVVFLWQRDSSAFFNPPRSR